MCKYNDWIKVEDALPEDDEAVFVFVKTYNNKPYDKVEPAIYREDDLEFEGFYYYFKLHEVTHWQPLPEPPK